MNITMSGETVVYWSLIFPLRGFRLPVNALHLRKEKANQLFGHVVHRQMLQPEQPHPIERRLHGWKMSLETRSILNRDEFVCQFTRCCCNPMFISYVTYCSLPKSFLKLNHFNLYLYYVITKISSASIIHSIPKIKRKGEFFLSTQPQQFVHVLFRQFTSNLNLVFKLTTGWRVLHNIFCVIFYFLFKFKCLMPFPYRMPLFIRPRSCRG